MTMLAAGQKRGTEVFESGSDDDWRIWHDLQSAAAVSEQQRGEVAEASSGAFPDRCFGVWDGAGEWAEGDVDGAFDDAAGDGWGAGAD